MTNLLFKLLGILFLIVLIFRDWSDLSSVLFGVALGLYLSYFIAADLID